MKRYTVGIDYGTLSGRAVLMDIESGEVIASSVCEYPNGVIDESLSSGRLLPKNTALQDAEDYVCVLKTVIRNVITDSGIDEKQIVGMGFDFTGCTLIPVDEDMRPLMFREEYRDEPHAYVKLWKHNSCQNECNEINRVALECGEKWLSRYGGKTSSGWMFPKILQILREAPQVYEQTDKFLNTADWITYLLTGQVTNSASFAGFKELWNEENGFPSNEFFGKISPKMENIIGTKICDKVIPMDSIAGYITKEAAELTGLPEGIPVATPILDAHASIPAAGLTEEGVLMVIFGTSAVYVVHSREKTDVPGICGYMKDGIIPDLYSYEASQASCGDHLDWFVKNCLPEEYTRAASSEGVNIHKYLRERAQKLSVGESGLLYLDWQNGNRSILADSSLSGALFGLTLRTRPEDIYRALIEGTVFGARTIIENFEKNGIRIKKIIASGGIAEKDELFMQICADVLNREITVSDAKMSASKGSAIYASVAAGAYGSITEASDKLGVKSGKRYFPIAENAVIYDRLYSEYSRLHEYFGRGENDLLRELRNIGKINY